MTTKQHTTLHVNCAPEDKRRWQLTARAQGMSLPDWVSQQLNRAAIDVAPAWADGLSERATICLLSRGYACKEQVALDRAMGCNFEALPNAGPSVKKEIEAWLKS